ncbi:MAG: hypothetical protein ACK5O7_07430 [Holosporales bacterium]
MAKNALGALRAGGLLIVYQQWSFEVAATLRDLGIQEILCIQKGFWDVLTNSTCDFPVHVAIKPTPKMH